MTGGVVIVGGGVASLECARQLRRNGYADEITILSAEAALPYERPVLSKAALQNEQAQIPLLTSNAELQAAGIRFCLGVAAERIVRSDHYVLSADGKRFHYDQLVIATGSRARNLAVPGSNLPGTFNIREWSDVVALRRVLADAKSIIIIGGGLIGLEVASSCLNLGKKVTVVEGATVVMSRSLPSAFGEFAFNCLSVDGVQFALGRKVSGFSGKDRLRGILLDDGTELATDIAICGIGVVANDNLAHAAGLKVFDGVQTDYNGKTSDPSIFAIGDVAAWGTLETPAGRRHETYNDAIHQAHVVAATICGQKGHGPILSTFWSDQHGLRIQGAGEPCGDDIILRYSGGARSISGLVLKAANAIGAFAINAPIDFAALKRFIGRPIRQDVAAAITKPETQLRMLLSESESAAA